MTADLALFASNPGIALASAALLVPFLPAGVARGFAPGAALVALAYAFALSPGEHGALTLSGMELQILRVDAVSRLFALAFLAVAALAGIYGWHDGGRIERTAGLILAGAATAAVFCGDLLTFFVFSGLATVASVFVVWARGSERSLAAGTRYALIQIAAGVVLLASIVMYVHGTGSAALAPLPPGSPGLTLMLVALGVQAAFPLLHSWLRDAYPEASPTGTVLLSAFTTKLALYVLLRGFAGTEALIWIGAVMVVVPPLFALFENDVRRALAWLLNSQLGLVVLAVGLGTEQALAGAVAFAIAHTLSMALLFMATGAVLTRTGTIRITELGGLRRSMPWTAGFYMVGAAAAGLPLFAGFTAVPMIVGAAFAFGNPAVVAALLAGLALGFAAGVARIPYRLFLETGRGGDTTEAPLAQRLAMAGLAVLCVLPGLWPPLLLDGLPLAPGHAVYAFDAIAIQVVLAAAGLAVFATIGRSRRDLNPAQGEFLDVDWVYRRALPVAWTAAGRSIDTVWGAATAAGLQLVGWTVANASSGFGPNGLVGRTVRVGNAVAWVTVLLLVVLLVAYIAG